MDQGRLIRRGRIPKNNKGDFWHWKDFNIGKDFTFYGKIFHTANCDLFTKVRENIFTCDDASTGRHLILGILGKSGGNTKRS